MIAEFNPYKPDIILSRNTKNLSKELKIKSSNEKASILLSRFFIALIDIHSEQSFMVRGRKLLKDLESNSIDVNKVPLKERRKLMRLILKAAPTLRFEDNSSMSFETLHSKKLPEVFLINFTLKELLKYDKEKTIIRYWRDFILEVKEIFKSNLGSKCFTTEMEDFFKQVDRYNPKLFELMGYKDCDSGPTYKNLSRLGEKTKV